MVVLPPSMPVVAEGVMDTLITGRHYVFLVSFIVFSVLIWFVGELERRSVARRPQPQLPEAWPALDGHPSPVR